MLLSILAVSSSRSVDRFLLPRNTVGVVVVVVGMLIFRRRSCNEFYPLSSIYTYRRKRSAILQLVFDPSLDPGDQRLEYSLP